MINIRDIPVECGVKRPPKPKPKPKPPYLRPGGTLEGGWAAQQIMAGGTVDRRFDIDAAVIVAKKRISKMLAEEKWVVIDKSFGMWDDYPKDWLIRLRGGSTDGGVKTGA